MSTRTPTMEIFVGAPGTGKTTIIREHYLDISERTLIVPANRADAAQSWPGIAELPVAAMLEKDELDPDPKAKGRLVVYAPEMDSFTGTRLLHVTEDPRRFSAIHHPVRGIRRATLVMDDTKNYITTKADLPHQVATIFRSFRHYELDIIMAVHQFDDINRQLFGWGCELRIFRTDVPPNDAVAKKVRNYEELLATIDRVNRMAQSDPHYCEAFTPSAYPE